MVDQIKMSTSAEVKGKLHKDLNLFISLIESQKQFNILVTVFKIQVQGLQDEGFFSTQKESSQTPSSSKSTPVPSKPIESSPSFRFKKISPLLDDSQSIPCDIENCQVKFNSRRAYISHMNSQHPNKYWTPDPKKTDPQITCEMESTKYPGQVCGAKLALGYMYTHLRESHKTPRPTKFHHLRGFYKGQNRAVFLLRNEPDPEASSDLKLEPLDVDSNKSDSDDGDEDDSTIPNKPLTDMDEDDESSGTMELEKYKDTPAKHPQFNESIEEISSDESDFDSGPNLVPEEILTETPLNTKSKRKIKRKLDFEKTKEDVDHYYCSDEDVDTDIDGFSDDSDFEEGDTDDFTSYRKTNKKERHDSRNIVVESLSSKKENHDVIEDMKKYLKSNIIGPANKESSTITKAMGHLFLFKDSYLNHLTQKHENFTLNQLIDFEGPNFLPLDHPGEWIRSTYNEVSGKAVERLKCHASLRNYVQHKAEQLKNLELKNEIFNGCRRIQEQIANERLYKKYRQMYECSKNRLKNAKMVLKTSQGSKIQNLMYLWNHSQTKMQLDFEYEDIYERSMETGKISGRDFTKWSNWTRFNMMLSDKGRAGVYEFTNEDFVSRIKMYFPLDYDDFNRLPPSHNPFEKPYSNPEPTNYAIQLSGDLASIKMHDSQSIIITKQVADLCVAYIELRNLIIPKDKVEDHHPFFINDKQKKLARLQNTTNSLLHKMGQAVGTHITVNTIRKYAETVVQANQDMTAKSKSITGHSRDVGYQWYYNTSHKTQDRAEFVNHCKSKEATSKANVINEERAAKRRKMDEEDEEIRNKKAQEIVRIHQLKSRENLGPGKRIRVNPKDKAWLLEFVSKEVFGSQRSKFPKGNIKIVFFSNHLEMCIYSFQ